VETGDHRGNLFLLVFVMRGRLSMQPVTPDMEPV
jgi:hypothetical protein